jgi:hypothetical protein
LRKRPESPADLAERGFQVAGVQLQDRRYQAGFAHHPGFGQVVAQLQLIE